jgi:hypothetical protein
MVMNLYEPLLPPIEGPDDLQPVHVEWAEDQAMETAEKWGGGRSGLGVWGFPG